MQVVWLNFIIDSQFYLGWEGPGAQGVISLTSASSTYLGNFRHRFPSTENPQRRQQRETPHLPHSTLMEAELGAFSFIICQLI